jgi:LPXTG-motif cell wall-anchored protein
LPITGFDLENVAGIALGLGVVGGGGLLASRRRVNSRRVNSRRVNRRRVNRRRDPHGAS